MAEDDLELHILNGDFAFSLWEECNFSGQSLIWKETYLEGPLPDTDDLHRFRVARTDFLLQFAELSGIDRDRLCRFLKKLDDSVLDLPENAALYLWFDSCIFDQTILMRILYLLHRKNDPSVRVFLYCCDGNCLKINDFKNCLQTAIQLSAVDFAVASAAWRSFVSKDAGAMIRLAEEGDWTRLPKMQKALLRCADEVPDRDGLTRTQRQMLQLVAGGCRSFVEIFKGLDAFEEASFLGDTACRRLLDDLIVKGILKQENGAYFPVTAG